MRFRRWLLGLGLERVQLGGRTGPLVGAAGLGASGGCGMGCSPGLGGTNLGGAPAGGRAAGLAGVVTESASGGSADSRAIRAGE